jgi:hypothetical protein
MDTAAQNRVIEAINNLDRTKDLSGFLNAMTIA